MNSTRWYMCIPCEFLQSECIYTLEMLTVEEVKQGYKKFYLDTDEADSYLDYLTESGADIPSYCWYDMLEGNGIQTANGSNSAAFEYAQEHDDNLYTAITTLKERVGVSLRGSAEDTSEPNEDATQIRQMMAQYNYVSDVDDDELLDMIAEAGTAMGVAALTIGLALKSAFDDISKLWADAKIRKGVL